MYLIWILTHKRTYTILPQLSIYIILIKSFWFTSSDVRKNLMDLVSTPTLPVSLIFWECGYVNMWLLEHLEIIVRHPHPTQLISIFSPTSANHYHIFNILFFFRSLFDIILLETTNQIDTQHKFGTFFDPIFSKWNIDWFGGLFYATKKPLYNFRIT